MTTFQQVKHKYRSDCQCRPGDEANGWHERRCPDCLAKERQAFSDAIATGPRIVGKDGLTRVYGIVITNV